MHETFQEIHSIILLSISIWLGLLNGDFDDGLASINKKGRIENSFDVTYLIAMSFNMSL